MKQIFLITALHVLSLGGHAQTKYALLIGINDYYEVKGKRSEDVSLHGSVNDASAVREMLINTFKFKSKNIDTLYNVNATRDNIERALKKKLQQCKRGDAMVFYYSGHGVYLYNRMEKTDSVKKGMNQAMLTSDLYNYDDHLKCLFRDFALKQYFNLFIDKKVILTTLFDCCFSGKLAMATPFDIDTSEVTKSIDLNELLGRLTRNASSPQLLIDSITGNAGKFVYSCKTDSAGNILNNTDTDRDGVPDCKDKEINTPMDCFPTDSDGVGSCPFDYMLSMFRNAISKYDSAKFTKMINHQEESKAFNQTEVLTVSEKDTIERPANRKDSKFLFMSATTDLQKAVEFNDENGVRHSLFTASLLRVMKKNPPDISADTLFQKISDDMNSYHKDQTPTLSCDPNRKNKNLVGVKL